MNGSAPPFRSSRRKASADIAYEPLEPRQMLAVTASLASGTVTFDGDSNDDSLFLAVNGSGELIWSEDGMTFSNDLDGATGTQPHTLTTSSPLNVTVTMGGGEDDVTLDIGGTQGLGVVNIKGQAKDDVVTVVSDLDLLPAGSFTVEAEDVEVQSGVTVAAPLGITIDASKKGEIRILDGAIISTRAIATGGNHELDPSIEDSGNINLSARTILIEDNTGVFAHATDPHTPGDINIKAEEQIPITDLLALDLSDPTIIVSIIDQQADALVDIGESKIFGRNIVISATADAPFEIPDFGDIWDAVFTAGGDVTLLENIWQLSTGKLVGYVSSNPLLPVNLSQEAVTATVNIGANATIRAAGDLQVTATSKTSEKSIVKSKLWSLAVVELTANSAIDIQPGSQLSAVGTIGIYSTAEAKGETKGASSKNVDKDDDGDKSAIALAIALSDLDSTIQVAETALIHAGRDVEIKAKGKNELKSDANAGVYKDGGIATTVAMNFPESNVRVDVDGAVIADNLTPGEFDDGIIISAELEAKEDALAYSGLGGEAPKKPGINSGQALDKVIEKWIEPIMQVLQALNVINETTYDLDIAGALALNETDHDVVARVGSTGVLKANLNIKVESKVTSTTGTFAESVVKQGDEGEEKDSTSVAVVVGLYDTQSHAFLEQGATVDAREKIEVKASTTYPFKPKVEIKKKDDKRILVFKGNSWARSHAEDGRSEVAGSVNYQNHENSTRAYIEDQVLINQDPAYFDIDQRLEVKAESDLGTFDIAGVFQLKIDITKLTKFPKILEKWKADKFKGVWKYLKEGLVGAWNDSDINFGTGSENTAVGGAITFVDWNEETLATIGDDVEIRTGEDGGVTVGANAKLKHFTFALAGVAAKKVGIAGSLGHNRHTANTVASIGHGTNIENGALKIESKHDMDQINLAGAAIHGANFGFGVSIASNNIHRDTLAYIGNPEQDLFDPFKLLSGKKVSLSAKSEGAALAISLSGVLPKKGDASNNAPEQTSALSGNVSDDFTNKGDQGDFGLAVSGDVSINRVHNNTQAFIDREANLEAESVSLSATDDTALLAAAGTAALAGDQERSIGIAGSFSRNRLTGNALAWIDSAVITATKTGVTLSATREGDIWAASASAGIAESLGIAGSVSLNSIAWETRSYLLDTQIEALKSLSLSATDKTNAFAIGGAVGWSSKSGFGAAFTLNQSTATTSATIDDSALNIGETVSSTALHEASYVSAAGSLGKGNSLAVAGTVALNILDHTVESSMEQSMLSPATGSIGFSATDKSNILAVSGAVTAYKGSGFAGAFAGNFVDQTIAAFVDTVELSGGSLTVSSTFGGEINSFAVGVAGQRKFGFAGSMSLNDVDIDMDSLALNSGMSLTGDVKLSTTNKTSIFALSGGFAFGSVAIGAAVSLNTINADLDSQILQTTVSAGAGIELTMNDTSIIRAVAVGGAGADKFALGGSVATNKVITDMSGSALNSTLTTVSDVVMTLNNESEIHALTGGLAGAGTVAIGAAFSLNEIQNRMDTYVLTSTINSAEGSITLSAINGGRIRSLAVGGAGAGTFALGGSVSTNEIDTDVDVHITDSTVLVQNDVSLLAQSEDTIEALTGGVAGAGSVAIGAAVSLNRMTAVLRACVVNSIVTATSGSVDLATINDSDIQSIAVGGAGAGTFALGGSVTINRIDVTLCTCILEGSVVTANGNVRLRSVDSSDISAFAGGFAGAGSVAVGIAVADNRVTRNVKGIIEDSDVTSNTGDIIIDVRSRGSQDTIAIGGAIGGIVAATGSVANNRLAQNLEASAKGDTSLDAAGHVIIRANAYSSADVDVYSGSGSGTFSVAGAVATTNFDQTTFAFVGANVSVVAGGNVLIETDDETVVDSVAGQIAGAGGGGLGASVSTVNLQKDTQAYIDTGADVYAGAGILQEIPVYSGEHSSTGYFYIEGLRGVAVQSTSNEDVSNLTAAGAGGLYVGVAGAVSVENIQPNTEAWIGRNATVRAGGRTVGLVDPGIKGDDRPVDQDPKRGNINVNVSAAGYTQVQSFGGSLGIGAGGVAGGIDVGKIQHRVWGHIDAGAQVTAVDDIDVHGLSRKAVDSKAVSGAAGLGGVQGSVSVWNIGSQFDADYSVDGSNSNALTESGFAIDGFASQAADQSHNRVASYLGESSVNDELYDNLRDSTYSAVIASVHHGAFLNAGDDIDVRAREWMDTKITTGGVALGFVGAGASVSVLNLNSTVDAYVLGNLTANDDILVQSTLDGTSDVRALAGQGGLGALGAAVAIINDTADQYGRIEKGANVYRGDRVTVQTWDHQSSDVQAGQAAIGLAAIGASVAKISDSGWTHAYISGANVGTSGQASQHKCDARNANVNDVFVLTDVRHAYDASATAIDAGILTGSGTIAKVEDNANVRTWIGASANVSTRADVNVDHTSTFTATTDALGVIPISGANFGVAKSQARVTPRIETYIQDAKICVGNDLGVENQATIRATADGQAVKISIVNGDGLIADAIASPTVTARITGRTTNVTTTRDARVGSVVDQTANVDAKGISVSLVGGGVIKGTAETKGSIQSEIGATTLAWIGRNLEIVSDVSGNANTTTTAPGFGILNFVGSKAIADASFNSTAAVNQVGYLTVGGSLDVNAQSDRVAHSDAKGLNISLAAAIGTTQSKAIADGSTQAQVNGIVNSSGSLAVSANENNTTTSKGNSTNGGLISGAGIQSETRAYPVVRASISSRVNSVGNVTLGATATMKTQAHGQAVSGNVFGYGKTEVDADIRPQVEALLNQSATVTAGGNVSLSANQSLASAIQGTPLATGEAGQYGLAGSIHGLLINATSAPTIRAQIETSANVSNAGNLSLSTNGYNHVTAEDRSVSIGGLVSGGKSEATVNIGGSITSRVLGTVGQVGNVTLSSQSTALGDVDTIAGGFAGLVNAHGGTSRVTINPSILSSVGTNLNIAGDLSLTSHSVADADAYAKANGGAGIYGRGDTQAIASIRPSVLSQIEARKNVSAGGAITIESRHNRNASGSNIGYQASATSQSAQVAIGVSSNISKADAVSQPTVRALAGAGATLNAGEGLTLKSLSFSESVVTGDGFAFGVIAGVGRVEANATSNGTTEAGLDSIASANVGEGNLIIHADARSDAHGNATAKSGGILVGGNAARTYANSSPIVNAFARSSSPINVGANVDMMAKTSGDVTSKATETGGSGLFNKGNVEAEGIWRPTVRSQLQYSTQLNAGGSVAIKAYSNHLESGRADSSRKIDVDANSNGGALISGRKSKSLITVQPTVHAQVLGGAGLNAGSNLVVTARSFAEPDAYAFTKLIGLAGTSRADSIINVWMSTRAETVSGAGININTGGDILIDSKSILCANAFAQAKAPTPLALRRAYAYVNNYLLETRSLFAPNTFANAGGDVTLFAYKILKAKAKAKAFAGISNSSVNNWGVITQAQILGGVTNAGGTVNQVAIDPIIIDAEAIVTSVDDEGKPLDNASWNQLLREGSISAEATVDTQAEVWTSLAREAKVSGKEGVLLHTELEAYEATANASIEGESREIPLNSAVKTNLRFVTDYPGIESFDRTFDHTCPGFYYIAEIFNGPGSRYAFEDFPRCEQSEGAKGFVFRTPTLTLPTGPTFMSPTSSDNGTAPGLAWEGDQPITASEPIGKSEFDSGSLLYQHAQRSALAQNWDSSRDHIFGAWDLTLEEADTDSDLLGVL